MTRAGDCLPFELTPNTEPKPTEAQKDEWFNHFWAEVWAKIGVGAARKAFGSQVKCREDAVRIWRAAKAQRASILQRAADSTNGTPIHPSTWLNQKRYMDEPVALPAPTPTRRPTVVAVDPAEIERQRREVTPDAAARANAAVIAKWADYIADPRTTVEEREWAYREFPELRKGASA